MGRCYVGIGSDLNTNATTIAQLVSAATIRPKISSIVIGSGATPADQCSGYRLQRTTTAGTGGTAFTPVEDDPGDPASLATFRYADTGEPSYTSNKILLEFPLNQRATFRWVAVPGHEKVLPAVAANGAGLLGVSPTSAFTVTTTFEWEE